MFRWLSWQKPKDPKVEADAQLMIDRYGEDAFLEARLRQHDEETIDGNRPPGHWERVKEEIRRLRGLRD